MCYDIKVNLERQLKLAKRKGDKESIAEIESKLMPLLNPMEREFYQVSGFDHPKFFVENKSNNGVPFIAEWGLIPEWIKTKFDADIIRNKTLNARLETIKEKPSFKDLVRFNRCVIRVDGFYEHHHRNRQTFPYFISNHENELVIAGLWSKTIIDDTERITCCILTKPGNVLMSKIHNNPKLDGSRMPLILDSKTEELWLNNMDLSQMTPELLGLENEDLFGHTVKRFKKSDMKNSESADKYFRYSEIEDTLF